MRAKYQIVAEALRSEIAEGRYPRTLPPEQALCARFQVSRQTVRQALSLLESERLIDRRQGSGSHVIQKKQPSARRRLSIAVVTTYISDYIFPSILREIEAVCSENDSAPLLFATQNQFANERKILLTLLGMEQLDGVLVEGTKTGLPNPNIKLYQKLIDRGVPLVFIHGDHEQLPDTLSVLDDNVGGGRMLVDYLYRKGHRKIGGIFKYDDLQGRQRFAGYLDAMLELGLPLEDRSIVWYSTDQKERFLREGIDEERAGAFFSSCSAVVCYNDEIASLAVAYLNKIGLSVPGDVAIVSFDNSQYSELSIPRITSLSHEPYNVGRMAAELLFRHLRGEACVSALVPWTLVEKESS
ncbi:MAG: GntR family transcriptional regulator [Oscillospiraceae bacterium]|nr:GntR family transcriptional regulator [Oscillospiraceae bacterium]